MNEEELSRLLEKYYNGKSTEEEEKILKDYFSNSDSTKDYEAERDIFGYYQDARQIPDPSFDFEARIMAEIDTLDNSSVSHKNKKNILPFLSAAAVLLIAVSSYFFLNNRRELGDTFTDPHIAYAETVKILMSVSSQLNHGTQVLEPVGKLHVMTEKCYKTINKPAKTFEKNLNNLDHLQKAFNIIDVSSGKNINKK
jgi:hypothetical protein